MRNMPFLFCQMLEKITIKPIQEHTATLIFLHGLGDTGDGWSSLGPQFQSSLPNVKFIFPHAPYRKVTLNAGQSMPAWFDIKTLNSSIEEDELGMNETFGQVMELINLELDQGIPSSRIILGGFSQGGAISLLSAIKMQIKLGGFISLSGFLPLALKVDAVRRDANAETPIFMGHGTVDPLVLYTNAQKSHEKLKSMGYKVEFKPYDGLAHSANAQELDDVLRFVKARLQ